MRPGPARKTKPRHPPRRWRALCGPEDHRPWEGRGRAPESDYRSTSAAAFELHWSRLESDPSAAEKIKDLNGLAGFGAKPFRPAKLTACRKCRVFIGGCPGCQGGKGRKH